VPTNFAEFQTLESKFYFQVERVQALRLIRKLAFVGPRHFPPTLVRCLVAIAEDGKKECDRLYRICLACLCELSVLNSQVKDNIRLG
jgi:hypothetical protein